MANRVLQTPFARLSYPTLFTPKANDSGKLIYQCILLFPKDFKAAGARLGLPPALIEKASAQILELKKLAAEVAKEYYGAIDKIPMGIKNQDLGKASGWPFRDQADKSGDGYEPGALYISLSSGTKPGIVDRNMTPVTNETDIYPGCWVRASVNCYGYRNKGNTGISFGLNHIQKLADDAAIAGRGRPDEDFEPVDGTSVGADAAESADSLFN